MNFWHRKDWDHNMAGGAAHHMHGGNKLHCPSGSAAHKAEAEPLQAGSWQQLRGCQSENDWACTEMVYFILKEGDWCTLYTGPSDCAALSVKFCCIYVCEGVQGWCSFTPLLLNMSFGSSSNCKCSRWNPFCSSWGISIYSYSFLPKRSLFWLSDSEKREAWWVAAVSLSVLWCVCTRLMMCDTVLIRTRIWSEGSISKKYHNLSNAVVVSSAVNGHLSHPDKVWGLQLTGRHDYFFLLSGCQCMNYKDRKHQAHSCGQRQVPAKEILCRTGVALQFCIVIQSVCPHIRL